MNTTGKLIAALTAAAAAGFVAGILLAPAKGTETRKKINKGVNQLAEDLTIRVKNTGKQLAGLKDSITDGFKKVEDLI